MLTLRIGLRAFALALLQGPAETVGLGAGLDDVGTVSDAVDQRLAQPGIGNHLGPFRERQVGSDEHGVNINCTLDDLKPDRRDLQRITYECM